jgi:hypothetical protein
MYLTISSVAGMAQIVTNISLKELTNGSVTIVRDLYLGGNIRGTADFLTNYVPRTGGTMSGVLNIINDSSAGVRVYSQNPSLLLAQTQTSPSNYIIVTGNSDDDMGILVKHNGNIGSLYFKTNKWSTLDSSVKYFESDFIGNASGLTNLAPSELNAATSFVRKAGDTATGAILTTRTTGFAGDELVPADWVRGLFEFGAIMYHSTNTASDVAFLPTNTTKLGVGEVPSADGVSTIVITGLNQYVSTIISTNAITDATWIGPATTEFYAYSPSGTPSANYTLSVKTEFYYVYNKSAQPTLGDWSAGAQSMTLGSTNLYKFVMAFPNTDVTGTAYRVVRLKVTSMGANATNLFIFRGPTYPSRTYFREPSAETLGTRGATGAVYNTGGITSVSYNATTREFNIGQKAEADPVWSGTQAYYRVWGADVTQTETGAVIAVAGAQKPFDAAPTNDATDGYVLAAHIGSGVTDLYYKADADSGGADLSGLSNDMLAVKSAATGTIALAQAKADSADTNANGRMYSITNPVEGAFGYFHNSEWVVNTNIMFFGTNFLFHWASTNSPARLPCDGE